jgi:DNA-binding protein Fis
MLQIKVGRLNDMIDDIIQKVCLLKGGNKSEAADFLGVSRTTVWKKSKSKPG